MRRRFRKRKPSPTDLTWEEKNPINYLYHPSLSIERLKEISKKEQKMKENVYDYLEEFTDKLRAHLLDAKKRWGDAWKKSPKAGLNTRMQHHIEDEILKFEETYDKQAIYAMAGYALIWLIRLGEFEEEK